MELSGAIVAFSVEEAVLEGPDEEGVKKLRTQQLEVLSLVTDYLCAASEELGIVDEIVEAGDELFGVVLSDLVAQTELGRPVCTLED